MNILMTIPVSLAKLFLYKNVFEVYISTSPNKIKPSLSFEGFPSYVRAIGFMEYCIVGERNERKEKETRRDHKGKPSYDS